MDIRNEILSMIPALKDEAKKEAALEATQQRVKEEEESAAAAELDRKYSLSRKLAIDAATLLTEQGVPTTEIWDKVITGESEKFLQGGLAGVHWQTLTYYKVQAVDKGWHLLTSGVLRHDADHVPYESNTHYLLTESGELQTFKQLGYRGPAQFTGREVSETNYVHFDGPTYPKPLHEKAHVSMTNSDDFKKAVASLIAGLGVYKKLS